VVVAAEGGGEKLRAGKPTTYALLDNKAGQHGSVLALSANRTLRVMSKNKGLPHGNAVDRGAVKKGA